MPYDHNENGSTEPGRGQLPVHSPRSASLQDYVALPATLPPLLPFLCTLPVILPGVFPLAAIVFILFPGVYAALLKVGHRHPADAQEIRDYVQRFEEISRAGTTSNFAGKQLWRENLSRLLQFSMLEKVFLTVPALFFSPLVLSIFFVKPALYEAIISGLIGLYPGAGRYNPLEPAPESEPGEALSPVDKAVSTILALGVGAVIVFIVGACVLAVWLMWMISANH